MLILILDSLKIFGLSVIYRLRGGGYVTLTSDVYCRLIWAAALTLAALANVDKHLLCVPAIFLAGFVMMYVPHAYCQNMGRWPTPQKGWPSFFFPSWTSAGWTAAPLWQRAAYDALQMACVAFLRGILCFAVIGFYFGLWHAAIGILTITIFQPVGYLLGCYVMGFNFPGCIKYTPTWGEFLNGAAWAVALIVAFL